MNHVTDPIFISKEEAKRMLRVTGRTLAEIETVVRELPTAKRGCRDKVYRTHVEALIAQETRPPAPVKPRTIRPLSLRHQKIFRAQDEAERIIRHLQTRRSF